MPLEECGEILESHKNVIWRQNQTVFGIILLYYYSTYIFVYYSN